MEPIHVVRRRSEEDRKGDCCRSSRLPGARLRVRGLRPATNARVQHGMLTILRR